MIGGRRARLLGAGLLAMALLLFTASLLFTERRLDHLTDSVAGDQLRSQLERVPDPLRAGAPAASAGPRRGHGSPAELGQLRTRFDVFWSRVESLRIGNDGALVRQLPGAEHLFEQLLDRLQEVRQAFEEGRIRPPSRLCARSWPASRPRCRISC